VELFILVSVLLLLLITILLVIRGKIISNNLVKSPMVQEEIEKISDFIADIKMQKRHYFRNSQKEAFLKDYEVLYRKFRSSSYRSLSKISVVREFREIYEKLNDLVRQWNDEYVSAEMNENDAFFNNIDGKSLDQQQRKAVIVDEDNNLVLAGAGSGKTLTISAKVKYLVKKRGVSPKDILLISFTKKSAKEMQDRVATRLEIDVEAKTFHKLGLEIISASRGIRQSSP